MPIDQYLDEVLRRLEAMYSEMGGATGDILFIDDRIYPRFRHETLTDSLVCYLKGVKAISTLKGCLILLQHGHTQEIGALCRMVDDFCNEIFFLLVPQGAEDFSDDQRRFVENFFQEEFDKPDSPLASTQKRKTVPVKKIHATFSKVAKDELNPSDAQELLRTIHKAFSGYVHGAYPQIMEMFGGKPPHFHMSGMLGTPRIEEWRAQLVGYVYRLIMATVFVARKLQLAQMETPIRELLSEFEKNTGTAPKTTAAEALAAQKRKDPPS
jgi:hypothetical protein